LAIRQVDMKCLQQNGDKNIPYVMVTTKL